MWFVKPFSYSMEANLMFVTGRGGAGFRSAGPTLSAARGGIFRVIPAPPPSGADPHSCPRRPPLSPPNFNGNWSGGWVGWREGQGMPKMMTCPGPLGGARRGKGPGARVLRPPKGPITNSKQTVQGSSKRSIRYGLHTPRTFTRNATILKFYFVKMVIKYFLGRGG